MSKYDVVFTGGSIVSEHAVFKGSVAVQDGKIARIVEGDERLQAEETVDLGGKHLLPGVVDCHQHLNEPGREHWEGYTPGSFASAAGGITTLMEMPFNSLPPTRNVAALEEKRQAVANKTLVDYAMWALVESSNLDELRSLHDAGAVAFKGFMLDPGTEFAQVNSFELLQAMEIIAETGSLIGLHAEDGRLVDGFTRRIKANGRKDAARLGREPPAGGRTRSIAACGAAGAPDRLPAACGAYHAGGWFRYHQLRQKSRRAGDRRDLPALPGAG